MKWEEPARGSEKKVYLDLRPNQDGDGIDIAALNTDGKITAYLANISSKGLLLYGGISEENLGIATNKDYLKVLKV